MGHSQEIILGFQFVQKLMTLNGQNAYAMIAVNDN